VSRSRALRFERYCLVRSRHINVLVRMLRRTESPVATSARCERSRWLHRFCCTVARQRPVRFMPSAMAMANLSQGENRDGGFEIYGAYSPSPDCEMND